MIRFVVFLVLHISVISFCPSYIEKKFDRVISNLGKFSIIIVIIILRYNWVQEI